MTNSSVAVGPAPTAGLFDSVFHEVDEAIAILSARPAQGDPIIVDINTVFERRIGGTRRSTGGAGTAHGAPLFSLLQSTNRQGREALAYLNTVVSNGKTASVWAEVKGKERPAMAAQVTVRPFAASQQDSAAQGNYLCIIRDVSNAASGGFASEETTNRILTFLSHDLRTPLNGILGFSEIMASDILGPMAATAYRAYARDIHAAGQELLRLINGLLDLSHGAGPARTMADSVFSLADTVTEALDAMAGKAAAGGVRLVRRISRALPHFRGDEARVRQFLLILLANALKFTPQGGSVTLTLRPRGGGAEIICADTGVGIAARELANAFQPYGSIEDAYTSPKAGIGVGLPLAKVLVEQHDGTMTVSSVEGDGTTFVIQLPAARFVA